MTPAPTPTSSSSPVANAATLPADTENVIPLPDCDRSESATAGCPDCAGAWAATRVVCASGAVVVPANGALTSTAADSAAGSIAAAVAPTSCGRAIAVLL